MQATGKLPAVKYLTWEITDACNSKCQTCNIWKHGKSPDVLTFEEIKKVFSDPLFKDLEVLLITGGEAVLRDDLLDILLFAHAGKQYAGEFPRLKTFYYGRQFL